MCCGLASITSGFILLLAFRDLFLPKYHQYVVHTVNHRLGLVANAKCKDLQHLGPVQGTMDF